MLAKTVATLDWLSNGRGVVFGVGGGWNREEMEDHGTPFSRRWQVLRERGPRLEGSLDPGRGLVCR